MVPRPKSKEDSLKKQYYENPRFTYAAKPDSLIHALEKEYPKNTTNLNTLILLQA
jgi:hypothetical protein